MTVPALEKETPEDSLGCAFCHKLMTIHKPSLEILKFVIIIITIPIIIMINILLLLFIIIIIIVIILI